MLLTTLRTAPFTALTKNENCPRVTMKKAFLFKPSGTPFTLGAKKDQVILGVKRRD